MEQPLVVNAENSRTKVQNVGGDSSGARHIKKSIRRFVTSKLASLLATKQLENGDRLTVDKERKELAFYIKKSETPATEQPKAETSSEPQPQLVPETPQPSPWPRLFGK